MFFSLTTIGILVATAASLPSQPRTETLVAPDIAAITSVDQSSFTSYNKNGLERHGEDSSAVQKRWTCNSTATLTTGDDDDGGIGVTINNADTEKRGFYIYHNNCDGAPYKYIWIDAGDTQFVSLPSNFEGRITRGTDEYDLVSQQWLGSWFEITYDSDGVAWADASLIRGCDGAVLLWSLDGTGAWKGFTQSILDDAPTAAYITKSDGQQVLMASENMDGSINTVPRDWYISEVGIDYAYVDDYHGSPVIASSNGRFGTSWAVGRP